MTGKVKGAGPAFPGRHIEMQRVFSSHDARTGTDHFVDSPIEVPHQGMTLRDYFAAKANVDETLSKITGAMADSYGIPMPERASPLMRLRWEARMRAFLKFADADAMIAAREAQ